MALRLFLFFLGLYVLTSYGRLDNEDLEVVFQTTRSVAEDGSFAIGDTPQGRFIIAQGFDVREGLDGRFYSWFGVGHALLGLPGYWIGQLCAGLLPDTLTVGEWSRLWVSLTNAVIGAWVVTMLYRIGRRLGATQRIAALAVCAYGAATLAWQHARGGFPGTACTAALALALLLLITYRQRGGRWRAAAAGLALAVGVAIRWPTALGAFVLGAYALFVFFRRRDVRAVAAFAAPALTVLGLLLWVNAARFGDPLESGYGEVASGGFFSFPFLWGLVYQIASPARSLLIYALPAVLGLAGILRFARHRRAEALAVGALFLAYLAFHAKIQGWHGAWTWGPRYLLPALALLTLPLMSTLEWAAARRGRRWAIGVLLGLSMGIQILGVSVHYGTAIEVSLRGAERRHPQRAEQPEDLWLGVLMSDPLFCPVRIHAKMLAVKLRWPRPETFDAEDLFGAAGPPIQPRERSLTGIPNQGFEHLKAVAAWKHGGTGLRTAIILMMVGLAVLAFRLARDLGRRAEPPSEPAA